MEKSNKSYPAIIYGICAVMAYIIFNQGGYFAGGIISTGLIIALILFHRCKIQLKPADWVFLAFSVWYLFCSLRPGFDIRYTAKGLLPMLCLMLRLLIPKDTAYAKALCEKVIKAAFYITIIAIAVCIYSSFKSGRLLRLTFPFQYANASGIFFGVMFILSRYADFEWAKKRQYLFFAGLIFTQSVGAIGVTVLAEIFLSKNVKKTLAMIAFILVGAVILKGRVYQSIGTFIERFLQMYDGFVCMLDNPLFGIGAGRWELVKNLYQSGFYDAKEIHSSVVAIGTASGFAGLALFCAAFVTAIRSVRFSEKVYPAAILMILGHCCLDFTLSFLTFGFLIMIFLGCGEEKQEKVFEVKPVPKAIMAIVLTAVFFVLSLGMYQMNRLNSLDISKKYTAYISYYEENPLSQKSVRSKENYIKALYATKDKEACLVELENMDVLSSDMIVLKKGCCDDWREALNYLHTQPYNSVLYKTVFYNSNDEALQKQTEEMLDEAINSMSFLGKILFNFKGEKVL